MSSIEVMIRMQPPASQYVCRDSSNLQRIQCVNKEFYFDHIFEPSSSQEDLFQTVGTKLICNTLLGYNSCLFVYGQTGSGKTYTMTGINGDGIVQASLRFLWKMLQRKDSFAVKVSYLEIYNETVIDLLGERASGTINLREDIKQGFYAEGLRQITVEREEDFEDAIRRGLLNRTTRETKMNHESSRSHSVMTVHVKVKEVGGDGGFKIKSSKLNFVDLAGSQKQKATEATGDRLKEASNINRSLTQLSIVISKLSESKVNKHIPYRDSALTKLLKDSLGGNAKTVIIATVSSKHTSLHESISTLLFAEKAKRVKIEAKVNEQVEGGVASLKNTIRQLQSKVAELEKRACEKCASLQRRLREMEAVNSMNTVNSIRGSQLSVEPCASPFHFTENMFARENHSQTNKISEASHESDSTVSDKKVPKSDRGDAVSGRRRGWFTQVEQLPSQSPDSSQQAQSTQADKYEEFITLLTQNIKNFKFEESQKILLNGQHYRITTLQETINKSEKQHQRRVDALQHENNLIREQYYALQEKLFEMEEEKRTQQRKLTKIIRDNEDYSAGVQSKLRELQTMQSQSQAVCVRAATLQLITEKQSLQNEIDELRSNFDKNSIYLSMAEEQLRLYKEESNKLVAELQRTNREEAIEIEKLRMKVRQQESELDDLHFRLNELQQKKLEDDDEKKELQRQRMVMKSEKNNVERQLAGANSRVSALVEDNGLLKEKVAVKHNQYQKLTNEQAIQIENCKALRLKVEKSQESKKVIENAMTKQELELQELRRAAEISKQDKQRMDDKFALLLHDYEQSDLDKRRSLILLENEKAYRNNQQHLLDQELMELRKQLEKERHEARRKKGGYEIKMEQIKKVLQNKEQESIMELQSRNMIIEDLRKQNDLLKLEITNQWDASKVQGNMEGGNKVEVSNHVDYLNSRETIHRSCRKF